MKWHNAARAQRSCKHGPHTLGGEGSRANEPLVPRATGEATHTARWLTGRRSVVKLPEREEGSARPGPERRMLGQTGAFLAPEFSMANQGSLPIVRQTSRDGQILQH